jgi:aspartate aminotransferase
MKFASRLDEVEISGLRKMFDLATEDSLNLGLGEPDFNPPESALDALNKAVYNGQNKYGPSAGIPQLREAVAEHNRIYRKDLTMDNVLITGSASEALMSAVLTFIEKGDEVLYPDPGFVLYKPQVQLAGGKPIKYPLYQEHNFVPRIDDLERVVSKNTKAIYVNSPSNPTGAVFDRDDVKAITDFAEDHDLVIISDEVYDRMLYDTNHVSFLGNYENVVFINSFSKIYAMTGWRLGYVVSNPEFIKGLLISHYHIMACPASPFQHAALATLKGPQDFVTNMVSTFKTRRDLIVEKLNSIDGMKCLLPRGAFYAFPQYEQDIKSEDLAMEIARAGTICSPGTAFGPGGEGHLRFSYAAKTEVIEKGIDIVAEVMSKL